MDELALMINLLRAAIVITDRAATQRNLPVLRRTVARPTRRWRPRPSTACTSDRQTRTPRRTSRTTGRDKRSE